MKVGDGTGEISFGRWHHIRRNDRYKLKEAKSERKPDEKSEGRIVLKMIRTTQPYRREGALLQPG